MHIIVASDTFGTLPRLEKECDLFVHCGNFCPPAPEGNKCLPYQIDWLQKEFAPWLKTVPAKHKIIIPGDTDFAVDYLDPGFEFHVDAMYLRDQSATIDKMVVYGMPWMPMNNTRYLVSEEPVFVSRDQKVYEGAIARIPKETQILVTRVPPYGILDQYNGETVGDGLLLRKIDELPNLKMHLFGFAADMGGQHVIRKNVMFVNGNLRQIGYIGIEV